MIEAVGDRARVMAGVGTNDTAHTIELARQAEGPAPTGCWWSPRTTTSRRRPGWCPLHRGGRRHRAAGDALRHPGRSGVPITTETLRRLAEHERIVAVKDAKGDRRELVGDHATGLAFYSGDDANLPWLAVGAVGFVGVVGHLVGDRLNEMIVAYRRGRRGAGAPPRAAAGVLRLLTGPRA